MKYWCFCPKSLLYLAIVLFCLLLINCRNHSHEHHHEHDHAHAHEKEIKSSHDHGHANKHMHQTPFEELIKRFESEERTAYQKPDDVINYLGDLQGKKIMDIGAGTGYFSFRLAEAGASVIAADVDDRFLDFIKSKKEELGISDDKVAIRKVPFDAPSLSDQEVDMVIIVNTYHHIEDRENYFSKVHKGLKEGGSLVVIDYFKKDMPVGPPADMKIAADQVENELRTAGFNSFEINRELLPYQFIMTAR